MSTTHENTTSQEQIVEDVMSRQLYEVPSSTVSDEYYGVPDETVVAAVKDELLAEVELRGIDQDQVVFSGYNGDPHNKDETFVSSEQIQDELTSLAQDANARFVNGDFDADPELQQQYKDRLAELKARLSGTATGSAEYYFGNAGSLLNPTEDSNNPIHYAGVSPSATIAVYDTALLPEGVSQAGIATLTPEELDGALVFRFHPQYVDEVGNSFAD